MCSVPALPAPGAAVSLRVRAVDVCPAVPVVRLWGPLGEPRAEHGPLSAHVQAAGHGAGLGAGELGLGAELCAGELGLVQLAGLWHRCRVLSRRGRGCRVFLLDEGHTVTVSASYLARGGPQLLVAPPEALGCVVADLLPAGSDAHGAGGDAPSSEWTEEAMELLRHLHGKELRGAVRDTLMPQLLLVLELPPLVDQMRQLGLAARVSPCAFGRVLRRCLMLDDSGGSGPAQSDGRDSPPARSRQSYVEMRPGSSCGGQLEVGCTVDVVVTCAESPGYFWCQLKKCSEFVALMADIQEYCESSSRPHTWPQSVCLAQYSEDKRWYRALIISDVTAAEEVEVMYVDYGNRELVPLTSLRPINERFLELKAQAFRCSLYNLIQPNGRDPFVWDEAAVLAFQEFVDTSSEQFELQCTIFALASRNNRELFNIVDLMTPFQSACQFLTDRGLAKRLPPQSPLAASVRLHSFYYSMHEIKIGSEEDVFITHVDDPQTFYFQLERCAGALMQLSENIARLSATASGSGTCQKPGELCLARYADSQWYRGVLTETTPTREVFFVDFGNTETVEEDHLLPIPGDAHEILLLPMQAVKCSLVDIENVPQEATAWFKQAVLERQLKAIVVAKESGGKLLIELFDGSVQINAKLKEEFRLRNNAEACRCVKSAALYTSVDMEKGNGAEQSPPSAGESNNCRSEAQEGERSSKMHVIEKDANLQPAAKRERAAEILASEGKVSSNKDALLNKAGEEMQSLLPVEMDAESDSNRDTEGQCVLLKRVTDLPQQSVVPALTVSAYVSHVNSPLDFYVQLASDEAQLNSISERLKDEMPKIPRGQLLQAGDLICALYADDSLWYRAVVEEMASDHSISVQYIDYGNTSVVDVDQVRRLPKDLESIPAIGIHCFLSGLEGKKGTDWAEKAAPCFTERVSEVLLTCEFVEEVGGKWRVILSDDRGEITVDLADERSYSADMLDGRDVINTCEPSSPQAQHEDSSACTSLTWKFPEPGQTVNVYITVVSGPDYFWSCFADGENMTYIEEKIKEAENLGQSSMDSCIKSGDVCLAKYSEDGRLYRAKVTGVKGSDIAVIHVDYGSEETVSLEMLKPIPSELLQVPNQAFACCLSGFSPSEGSWLSEAKDKFYDITIELLLEAEIIGTQENKAFEVPLCAVKLESSGRNINEEMKSFWKADMGSGHKAVPDPESPLEGNRSPSSDVGLCLKRETATCGLAHKESESALLCSQLFSGAHCGCSEDKVSGEVAGRCETAEHRSSSDKEIDPLEDESRSRVLLEPRGSCSLHSSGSRMKSAVQEPAELLCLQDVEVKAEALAAGKAASPKLGNEEELMRWLQVEPSMGDTTEALIKLDELQMHSSYSDLKELILELEEIAALPSVAGEMKEVLETEALEMQTASGKAREKTLEGEVHEPLLLCEEMGRLAVLQSEASPSLGEGESLEPSVREAAELFPSDTERWTMKTPELNCSGVHEAEAMQEDWTEVEPPFVLPSSDGKPKKQPKAPDTLSAVSADIEQLLDLVLPSEEDGVEDALGLGHTVLQSSSNSGGQFSVLPKDLNQKPVSTAQTYPCRAVKRKEWQKKDGCCVTEWMQEDMDELFKECGSTPTHVQSSDCKADEEAGEKQSDNMADYNAGCSGYTCKLKGFSVGSKCVVWTTLKWCEALILEVSEKGTRVPHSWLCPYRY
ncbi:tudor domain-containing protein 6 isoform X2 [Coturnix japonica]|uniref:tudor domain-containing protein 6 isoform X2 n=1 Tax=Coturnix japonica TaxID=93934 RepID=UPI0013A5D482|nr:tudor domain-containing protein 6 isoform X2 [Coturnix japonica]